MLSVTDKLSGMTRLRREAAEEVSRQTVTFFNANFNERPRSQCAKVSRCQVGNLSGQFVGCFFFFVTSLILILFDLVSHRKVASLYIYIHALNYYSGV